MILVLELTLSLITGLCVLGVAPVLWRLLKKTTLQDITPEWVEAFSVERYRPMLNLLSNEDFAFLSRQPGFDPSIYKKLRRERLAIFQQYLCRLILDFKKLHTTARYLVAHSVADRSDLAVKLIRMRWEFALMVLTVQLRFQLCRIGIGTVQAQVLVAKLQQLSDQLGSIAVPQAA